MTKKLLEQGEIDKLQLRFDALKYKINKDDDEDGGKGSSRGGGGEVTMERQVHRLQKLHSKKWMKLLKG